MSDVKKKYHFYTNIRIRFIFFVAALLTMVMLFVIITTFVRLRTILVVELISKIEDLISFTKKSAGRHSLSTQDYFSLAEAFFALKEINEVVLINEKGEGMRFLNGRKPVVIKEKATDLKVYRKFTESLYIVKEAIKFKDKKLYIILFVSMANYKKQILFTGWFLTKVSILAILLGALLAIFLAQLIANPIKELQVAASKIARGEFDMKVAKTGMDEIGQLARIFDFMRQKIKNTISELKNKNIKLDRKVSELNTLHKISQVISETFNLNIICKYVVTNLAEHFKNERTLIFLVDEDNVCPKITVSYSCSRKNGNMGLCDDNEKNSIRIKNILEIFKEAGFPGTLIDIMMYQKLINFSKNDDTYIFSPFLTEKKIIGGMFFKFGKEVEQVSLELISTVSSHIAQVIESVTLYNSVLEIKNLKEDILKSVPVGVIVVSNLGIILEFNEKALEIFGKDLKDKNIIEFFTNTQLKPRELLDNLKAICLEGGVFEEEVEIETDGSKKHLEVKMSGLTKVKGAVIVIDDITERVNLIESVHRADKLVSLGRLAASVAHEIRNPLVTVSGLTELVCSRLPKDSRDYKNLVKVVEEVERLNKVIMELLQFVKPVEATLKEADIKEILLNVIEFMSHILKKHAVSVEVEEEDLPLVNVDREKIKQVFINLILNAIHSIKKSEKKIKIKFSKEEKYIRVEIEDNGEGIDEESIPKIFEPFYTTKEFGTGIGLYVVKRIIDSHKGKISVYSEKGVGSIFTLKLPLNGNQVSE